MGSMNATHTCHGSFDRDDHLCGCDRGRDHTEMQHKADMAERDQKEVAYTGTDDLVGWLRDFSGPGSNGTNQAADAIEALTAERDKARAQVTNAVNNYITASFERDSLRAQLDGMTTEWGTRPRGGDSVRSPSRAYAEGVVEHWAADGRVLVRRLVGPWVEVE